MGLTITKRTKIIKIYYKTGISATATYSDLRGDYGLHNRATTKAIGKIVKKFEETGMVTNIKRHGHHPFAHSAENIAIVSECVPENPNVSIPRCHQELGLSYGTLWCILHLELHLSPYIVQQTQQLKSADHSQHRNGMGARTTGGGPQFFEQNFLQR